MTSLTGLIGYPVSHSLSPVLHGYWLQKYAIDGDYKLFTTKPARLRQTMLHMRKKNIVGVNITVPHKQAVMEYLDEVDDVAQKIGAVNTIIHRDGLCIGTNTDASGFIAALHEGVRDLAPCLENVVVLGAGGATRAVLVALQEAGAKRITITNRTLDRASELVNFFSESSAGKLGYVEWESREELLKSATLVVNTTSLGMQRMPPLEMALIHLPEKAVVMDIVYAPLETDLLQSARVRGCAVIDGLGMLMHQAAAAFALWHGVTPQVDAACRAHVLEEIAVRSAMKQNDREQP